MIKLSDPWHDLAKYTLRLVDFGNPTVTKSCEILYSLTFTSFAIMASNEKDQARPNPYLYEFAEEVNTQEKAKAWLRKYQLFSSKMDCSNCDLPMELIEVSEKVTSDKELWKCSKCKKTTVIREGTIFKVSLNIVNFLLSQKINCNPVLSA